MQAILSDSVRPLTAAVRGPLGNSAPILKVRELVSQVAPHATVVLIQGESGSGKEVVARAIHDASPRANRPFIPVNCGAIPSELLESELFGHEKGAFTGAVASRKGRFELAEGGTLFLDEIGDMSLPMQVKLLRVLQERTFERVGSNQTVQCNVRIVAATHRDLEAMIEKGTFREDLYFRLCVFPIYVPPLRERTDDLPRLITHFNEKLAARQLGGVRLTPAAMEALRQYRWPGNIRELENLVERLSITHAGRIVGPDDLPPRYQVAGLRDEEEDDRAALLALTRVDEEEETFEPIPASEPEPASEAVMQRAPEPVPVSAPPMRAAEPATPFVDGMMDLKQYLQDIEVRCIHEALARVDGVVSHAARLLSLQRTTLVEKMKKLGIQVTN